jgi:acyl-[acyl-carrier-protein] desaturase
MEFFEKSEKFRCWSPINDIPWDKLDEYLSGDNGESFMTDEVMATCLETFCGVELFIPDYTKNGLNLSRDIFGQAWFHLAWGLEESKHALSFRQYLLKSGLRSLEQYLDYEETVLKKEWKLPFSSNRQMACYGALQEIATYLIYAQQREKYKKQGNEVLYKIFNLVGRDEAAHASFYRSFLRFEHEEDPQGTEEDLAYVITNFEMPGVSLIPDFYKRLESDGVGVSPEKFMQFGIIPTLKIIGMTRVDFVKALRRLREKIPLKITGGAGKNEARYSKATNGIGSLRY